MHTQLGFSLGPRADTKAWPPREQDRWVLQNRVGSQKLRLSQMHGHGVLSKAPDCLRRGCSSQRVTHRLPCGGRPRGAPARRRTGPCCPRCGALPGRHLIRPARRCAGGTPRRYPPARGCPSWICSGCLSWMRHDTLQKVVSTVMDLTCRGSPCQYVGSQSLGLYSVRTLLPTMGEHWLGNDPVCSSMRWPLCARNNLLESQGSRRAVITSFSQFQLGVT